MVKISVFGLRQNNQLSMLASYLQSQIPYVRKFTGINFANRLNQTNWRLKY